MRLLLDTHVYLWCVKDDHKLSKKARAMIMEATEVYVSSASIWEAAIKAKLGKLKVEMDKLVDEIEACGFLELPVSAQHAAYIYQLPDIHRDPFDRMLISQAVNEPLRLLSADPILQNYSDLVVLI